SGRARRAHAGKIRAQDGRAGRRGRARAGPGQGGGDQAARDGQEQPVQDEDGRVPERRQRLPALHPGAGAEPEDGVAAVPERPGHVLDEPGGQEYESPPAGRRGRRRADPHAGGEARDARQEVGALGGGSPARLVPVEVLARRELPWDSLSPSSRSSPVSPPPPSPLSAEPGSVFPRLPITRRCILSTAGGDERQRRDLPCPRREGLPPRGRPPTGAPGRNRLGTRWPSWRGPPAAPGAALPARWARPGPPSIAPGGAFAATRPRTAGPRRSKRRPSW